MAQQTIGIGAAPNDGTGDPIRTAFDKCNDNFTELYGSLAGLLDFQGATDCSTNPNYPAASQGDIYIVSGAGKIGGASGKDVEVGDFYLALADNAGGTEASVGTSWAVLQANITGGIGSGVDVEDEGVAEATAATILNFTGAGVTAADVGGGQVDITIPGGGAGGVDVQDEGVAEATGATTLNFTGAGVTATDMGAGVVDVDIPGGGGGDFTFIGRTVVTTLSAVDIPLSASYDSFHIEFYFTPSNDNIGLNAAVSDDNFATVEAGATDYYYSRLAHSASATGVVSSSGTTVISVLGTSSIGSAANEYTEGSIEVTNAKETAPTHLRFDLNWITGSAAFGSTRCAASFKLTNVVDGLRITPTAGTLTGFYKIWGRTA